MMRFECPGCAYSCYCIGWNTWKPDPQRKLQCNGYVERKPMLNREQYEKYYPPEVNK